MSLNRGLPNDTPNLAKLFEEGLTEIRAGKAKNLYVTSCSSCYTRGAASVLIGAMDEITTKNKLYMTVGKAFEEVVEEFLEKKGYIYKRELPVRLYRVDGGIEEVTQNPLLSGRIDFLVKLPDSGGKAIIELKTCGKLPDKPKPEHLAQIKAYCALAGVRKGYLWYISRSVADWKGITQEIFEIELSDGDIKDVLTNLYVSMLSVTNNVVLPKPKHIKKTNCKFCPFFDSCWGDDKTVKFYHEQEENILKNAEMTVGLLFPKYEEWAKNNLNISLNAIG